MRTSSHSMSMQDWVWCCNKSYTNVFLLVNTIFSPPRFAKWASLNLTRLLDYVRQIRFAFRNTVRQYFKNNELQNAQDLLDHVHNVSFILIYFQSCYTLAKQWRAAYNLRRLNYLEKHDVHCCFYVQPVILYAKKFSAVGPAVRVFWNLSFSYYCKE